MTIVVGEGKKREILGPSPFVAPTLRGPTLLGPHLGGPPFVAPLPSLLPSLRGPHPSKHPPFGAPTLRGPHSSGPVYSGHVPSGSPPFGFHQNFGPRRKPETPSPPRDLPRPPRTPPRDQETPRNEWCGAGAGGGWWGGGVQEGRRVEGVLRRGGFKAPLPEGSQTLFEFRGVQEGSRGFRTVQDGSGGFHFLQAKILRSYGPNDTSTFSSRHSHLHTGHTHLHCLHGSNFSWRAPFHSSR